MTESQDISDIPEVMSLAPRERKLVKGLLSGLTESNAMRAAGYAESTIRAGTVRVCQRNRIQRGIEAAIVAAGITPDLLATKMREGLDAVNDKQMPDHAIRLKYVELAVRLLGLEPGKQIEEGETYEEQILRLRGFSSD